MLLVVVKIGWREAGDTSRMEDVLQYALKGKTFVAAEEIGQLDAYISGAAAAEDKVILFAAALPPGGLTCSYAGLFRYLAGRGRCLAGWVGMVLVDGKSELFTKKIGRELIFLANRAGCTFPGKPLVEGTESLYNFNTQARLEGINTFQAYKESAARLVEKTTFFAAVGRKKMPDVRRITVLHASSRATSNTLLLWEMIRKSLSPAVAAEEISLRNGSVVDCRGCSYEMCRHFGENGTCFYGGVIVEHVYPAVRGSDAIVLICPNYNDAVSANITAFFNRLTALFRTDSEAFFRKRVYALVVSGYSGGDIVAEQIIGAMTCNKNFILPGQFAMIETANDPNSILRCRGIKERAAAMAGRISGPL